LILFSQAPADIRYVLSLYSRYKETNKVHIFVVNVENNYRFFKSLDLDAEITFIPLVAQKNLVKYIPFLVQLRIIFKKYFSNTRDEEIYFFSRNHDYVTAYCIENLYRYNSVYFVDVYKAHYHVQKSILNRIKQFIMYLTLGISVYFDEYAYIYELDDKIQRVEIEVNDTELEPFKYTLVGSKNSKKNLLLYEANGHKEKWFSRYNENLKTIVEALVEKYTIFIKPHPRLGYSKFLDEYDVTVVPDYIPAELLSLEYIDVAVGIESTAIATSSVRHRYSLVPLFEYKDLQREDFIVAYLKQQSSQSGQSKGNLVFLNDLAPLL
jgi:hypothetical protein